jgi:sugar/nucleoside kinase (ribokinase family)
MNATNPVVCAGVIVADHLCTPVDHLPEAGELVAADDLLLNIGGCASNAAMNLARLGVRASILGKIGADVFGKFVADTLAKAHVDVDRLIVDPLLPTSQTLIVNVKAQDRRFIHAFGANKALTVADLDPALSAAPKVFYLGGYLILPGLDRNALAKSLAQARARGTVVVLDVATPGPGDYLRHLEPVLPHTDVFLPNEDEAKLILNESDPYRQAKAFQKLGAKHVVITRGSKGVVAVSNTLEIELEAFPVEFVDGSGGGDAFDAGYITGLIEGLDETDRLILASAVGASCVRAVGATAGVFTRGEAQNFIENHPAVIKKL